MNGWKILGSRGKFMANSNRERRKKKKKEQAKNKARTQPSAQQVRLQDMLDAEATELTIMALGDRDANLSFSYSLLRQMGTQSSSPVWKANKDVFELCLFSNKPEPWAPAELRQICETHADHLPFDYSGVLRRIDAYVSVKDWFDTDGALLKFYRQLEPFEATLLDYPAILHFHVSGMLPGETIAVKECLDFISRYCLLEEPSLFSHFLDILRPKKGLPTMAQLKKFDLGLGILLAKADPSIHDPQYAFFIEPSLRALLRARFLHADPSKLSKFPHLLAFLAEKPAASAKAKITGSDANILRCSELTYERIQQIKRLHASQSKTFDQHIKMLILEWRIGTLGSENQSNFGVIDQQREKNAFLALWSALSRGVPESKKDFALRVKDLCLEFVIDCLSKSPNYRPDSLVVDSLALHNPQHEILTWLQIAKTKPHRANPYLNRLPQRPKAMPFDLFYALYESYDLKSHPIFIEKYLDALPLESRREILIPWLRRLTHVSGTREKMDQSLASTFGKLLKPDRFPVNEMASDAEMEDSLVFWSLAYMYKARLDWGQVSYSRLYALLNVLTRLESQVLWKGLGEDLVLALLPQMLKPENLGKGIIKAIIRLLEKSPSSQIRGRLKLYLDQSVTVFNFDPAWQVLIDYFDRPGKPSKRRDSLPQKKSKTKPKSKRTEDRNLLF